MTSGELNPTEDSLIEIPCPLCGSRSADEVWSSPVGVANGVCTRCGHVYLCRRSTGTVIAESYAEYSQHYPESYLLDQSSLLFDVARGRMEFLKRSLGQSFPRTVLEIGCGYGHFLSLFEKDSTCYGIEPSRTQAEFARDRLGLTNVINSGYEACERNGLLGEEDFDLVCSFHVLEHVLDPVRFLAFARDRLEEGGLVCLAVPDLDTLSPDLIELYFISRSWHVHSFSRSVMEALLESQGFNTLAIETEGATPMLRSSTRFLARRDGVPGRIPADTDLVEQSRETAETFHARLEQRLVALRDAFTAWEREGHRVAVYGGGIHTDALLSLTGVTRNQVDVIIDDDPAKVDTRLHGVPVRPLESVVAAGVDVIVVSSLASEDVILARLEADGIAQSVDVKGVYRDLCS